MLEINISQSALTAYFLLLMVLTAISTKPSLASLSGKALMLSMAFSA